MPMFEKCCFCYQRRVIIFLVAVFLYQGSSTTHTLNHVIEVMVGEETNNYTAIKCNFDNPKNLTPYIDKGGTTYGWNRDTKNYIVRYFYVGYTMTHIIGGYLADKYGGKELAITIIGLTSVTQLITPSVIDGTNGEPLPIKILKLLQGLIEGMRAPTALSIIAHWALKRERAKVTGFICFGIVIGTLWAQVNVFLMYKYRNWGAPFYLNGGIGALLFVLWLIGGASYPTTSKYIQPAEKFYLHTLMAQEVNHQKKVFPFRKFLSLKVLAMCFGLTGDLWSWHFSNMFVFGYMRDIMKFDANKSKVYSIVPPVIMGVGTTFCGVLSDWAVNNNKADRTFVRKCFTTLALMGNPIYMIVGSYTICHFRLGHSFFVMSMAFEGFAFVGVRVVPLDMAANYAGFLTGLAMTPASICLMFYPEMTNLLIPNITLRGYRRMFYLTLAMSSFCCLFFVLLADCNTQEWNDQEKRKKSKNAKK